MKQFEITFVVGAGVNESWCVNFITNEIEDCRIRTKTNYAEIWVKPCSTLFWFLANIGKDLMIPSSRLAQGLRCCRKGKNYWHLIFDTEFVPCNLIVEKPDEGNA